MAYAEIEWIKYENGGKKKIPALNDKFYSHIKLNCHEELFNWSFVIINIEFITELKTFSKVDFLMNHAPQDLLEKNTKFQIYEGPKLVAHGVIKE